MKREEGAAVAQRFSILIGALSGILGAALLWGVQMLARQAPPRIATLDVRALMDEEITRAAKSTLTPQEAAVWVKRYGAQLSQMISGVAKERNLVIVPAQAVMAGAVDVTPLLKKLLRDTKDEN